MITVFPFATASLATPLFFICVYFCVGGACGCPVSPFLLHLHFLPGEDREEKVRSPSRPPPLFQMLNMIGPISRQRKPWDTGSLSLGLGLTHPCSTDVDMEPFSTSVNEVLS